MRIFSLILFIIDHINEDKTKSISVSSGNSLRVINSKFHDIYSTAITTSIKNQEKVTKIQIIDSIITNIYAADNQGGAMSLNSVSSLNISNTIISNCISHTGAALWISSIDSVTIEYLTVNNVTASSGAAISASHSAISISYSYFSDLNDIGTNSQGSSLFDFGICSTISIYRTTISNFTCISTPKVVFRFYLTTSYVKVDTVCISNEDENSPFNGIYIGDSTATASSYTLQHITFPYYMISSSSQIQNDQKDKTTLLDIVHANEDRCKDPEWTFSVSNDPWPITKEISSSSSSVEETTTTSSFEETTTSSIEETTTITSSSIEETTTSSIEETSIITSSSIDETSIITSSSIEETTTITSSSIEETTTTSSSSIEETTTTSSIEETTTTSSIEETSIITSSLIDETSIITSSLIDETSIITSSSIDETSIITSSSIDETSIITSSSIEETTTTSSIEETSSASSSSVDETTTAITSSIEDSPSTSSSSNEDSSTLTSSSNENDIIETDISTPSNNKLLYIIIPIIIAIIVLLILLIIILIYRKRPVSSDEFSNSESDIDYDQVLLLPSNTEFDNQIVMSTQM